MQFAPILRCLLCRKHLVYSRLAILYSTRLAGVASTAFQSLLSNRRAICSDISAVASCVSKAKVQAPSQRDVLLRLNELRDSFRQVDSDVFADPFYQACFSAKTLEQLVYLRGALDWKNSDEDAFISSLILGVCTARAIVEKV